MPKQKTLYYLPVYGQIGNQLAVVAHLLAFAMEYNYKIVYPYSGFFSKHLQLFGSKQKEFLFRKKFSNRRLAKGICLSIKSLFFFQNVVFNNYLFLNKRFVIEKEFNSSSQPEVIVVTDWLFRFYIGIKKYQSVIRQQLSFNDSSIAGALQKWQSLQQTYPQHTFIAIHVRRGDYAEFQGGVWYFDNDTYYRWMQQLAKLTNNPVFIICSNEDLTFVNQEHLNIVYAKGSPLDDLFLMSKCKYIIGPPSTFSTWSAFLGDQYIYMLEKKDVVLTLDLFYKYYL